VGYVDDPTVYYDRWMMPNGDFVGPNQQWYDEEKTRRAFFGCHNTEGELYGLVSSWHENGMLDEECNFKDGKPHGVCKHWSKDGTLIYECNYEEGECVSCTVGKCY
jgi:antitoxin component YwqK of YwqJK toxin-antitoxin module